MTADRLLTILIAWQTANPNERHIVDDLMRALRSACMDGVAGRSTAAMIELADRCEAAVKEMPDD